MNSMVRTSVNTKTIARFSKLHSIWWHPKLRIDCVHNCNEMMTSLVRDDMIINKKSSDRGKALDGLLTLEIGCGGGILSEMLAKLGGTLTSIDPSAELIQVAREHAKLDPSLTNVTYKLETVENHALNNRAKYDVAISTGVLHHVDEKETFLENCVKCLKPGGVLWLNSFNKTWRSWYDTVYLERIARDVPKGTLEWDLFISPEDLERILAKYNCKTVAVQGLALKFLQTTWRRDNSVSEIYALKAVKC